MHAYHRLGADQTDAIAVVATKEEWISILDKALWMPDGAFKEGDAWSKLVHWLINQGVYE